MPLAWRFSAPDIVRIFAGSKPPTQHNYILLCMEVLAHPLGAMHCTTYQVHFMHVNVRSCNPRQCRANNGNVTKHWPQFGPEMSQRATLRVQNQASGTRIRYSYLCGLTSVVSCKNTLRRCEKVLDSANFLCTNLGPQSIGTPRVSYKSSSTSKLDYSKHDSHK